MASQTKRIQNMVRTFQLVPVAPLRARFEELRDNDGLTARELARQLDWYAGGKPDERRVSRRLGLTPDARRQIPNTYVSYENAVALARALDLDPHEAGV